MQSSDQAVDLLLSPSPASQQEDDDELRHFSSKTAAARDDAFVYVENASFEQQPQVLESQDNTAPSPRSTLNMVENGRGIENAVGGDMLLTSSTYHDRQKERERTELVQMILESIANVPVAVERIHTNEKLRAALRQEMGEENMVLHRFFRVGSLGSGYSESESEHLGRSGRGSDSDSVTNPDDEDDDESDDSSGFGSEYENDLAEAVNQLCMSDDTLIAMERKISAPIVINSDAFEVSSTRTSNSPQSSINYGASPGNCSQDGEPVSALWPRQPHQFAFTQEEEANARGEDEVYSEVISSMCEDESFQGEEGDEEDDDEEDDEENGGGHGTEYDGIEKVFQMDEDDAALDPHIGEYRTSRAFTSDGTPSDGQLSDFRDGDEALGDGEGDEEDGDDDEDSEDDDEHEYEVVELRIIREKNKTGFEPRRDWRPRVGSLVGGRYKVSEQRLDLACCALLMACL